MIDTGNDFEERVKAKYGTDKESAYIAYINEKEDEVLSDGNGSRRKDVGSKNPKKNIVQHNG